MSLRDTDIAAYQSTRLCCTGSVTTLKILFFLQFCHYGDISLIIICSNIFLHCKFLQSSEDEVNEHHSAQLVSYIKFAKYQRGQCLKSVKAAVTDTKEVRINEDTFTADEVEEIIEAVDEAVRGEVESELLNTSHTNILLLKQLFSQAEKWHLNLDTDMSELENKDLLDAVKKWEEQELSGSKVDKQLDRGSKRSSVRYVLSSPYRMTISNSARLVHIVLFNIGDMHLVLPILNLSTLNAF